MEHRLASTAPENEPEKLERLVAKRRLDSTLADLPPLRISKTQGEENLARPGKHERDSERPAHLARPLKVNRSTIGSAPGT